MTGEGRKANGNRWIIEAQPTLSTSAYDTGDLAGAKLTFEDVISEDYGGGAIVSMQVIDAAAQNAELHLILFDEDLNSGTGAGTNWATGDNVALSIASSDLANCVGVVDVSTGDYLAAAANSTAIKTHNVPFYLEGKRKLYGLLYVKGAPTYTASNALNIRLGIERDAN